MKEWKKDLIEAVISGWLYISFPLAAGLAVTAILLFISSKFNIATYSIILAVLVVFSNLYITFKLEDLRDWLR